ncbi:MAG: HYR domain-containing protein [Bacteroidota bacterium]|nr:HYR domain-containing protein [Bacteroidota bacterium]
MKFLAVILLTSILVLSNEIVTAQSCKLTCPSNIVVGAEKGQEGALVSYPPVSTVGIGDCGTVTYSRPNGSFFRLGSYSVIATASTGENCSFTVTVTDNEPPNLSPITLSRTHLWPATNKMKKTAVNYTTSDNGENVKTALSVSSNTTDGIKDWEITDDHLLRLKSSRLPDGAVRIYTITVTATDEASNKTTRTTTIAVSPTMKAVPAD